MSLSSMSIGINFLNNNGEHAGHQGVTNLQLMQKAAESGVDTIRVPADLAAVGPNGVDPYQILLYQEVFEAADQFGLKIIFEPGQTPPDLSSDGTVKGHPENYGDLQELANRFGTLVQTVYSNFPQYIDLIEAWEVGNEPNLSYEYIPNSYHEFSDGADHRFYAVDEANAEWYADYLVMARAV